MKRDFKSLCCTGVWGLALLFGLSACAPLLVGSAVMTGIVATDRRTTGAQVEDEGTELKVASAVRQCSPATPVIMLTGWGQRLAADSDYPEHVDCVLGKPPRLKELRRALNAVMSTG